MHLFGVGWGGGEKEENYLVISFGSLERIARKGRLQKNDVSNLKYYIYSSSV